MHSRLFLGGVGREGVAELRLTSILGRGGTGGSGGVGGGKGGVVGGRGKNIVEFT